MCPVWVNRIMRSLLNLSGPVLTMSGIEVVYSDKHLVLVNKPSGLLSVPGRGPDKKDCLVRRLQDSFPTARIVHRLDCATSGLMVLALDADSHRELSRQFHDREVDKEYIARVWGRVEADSGEVDLPLITDWPNRPRQKVDDNGKPALTKYEVLSRDTDSTRVKLTPITGRSHQLRVHMLSLGHAILGDQLYACEDAINAADRLLLHAGKLAITQPETGERLEFCHAADF